VFPFWSAKRFLTGYRSLVMRWTKLNTTFDAEPNAPDPRVTVDGDLVTVRFFLNPFIWADVQDGDEAELIFRRVLMYRLGATNDEGFYRGQCRFSSSGIKWGDFYELHESNWMQWFPADKVVVSSRNEEAGLKHYLFYFRDETFECVAHGHEFQRMKRGRP
jgi:hypothetical protein